MTADVLPGLSHTLRINLLLRVLSAWDPLYVHVTHFTFPEALCFSLEAVAAFIAGGCHLENKEPKRRRTF